jgi:DNA-binding FadR family transcriptional regulator
MWGTLTAEELSSSNLRIPGVIARDLGVRIVSGTLRPGSVLEIEAAASEKLNVSRTAYREAIRVLIAKGLVCSKPKIGTSVNEREEWHLLDPRCPVMDISDSAGLSAGSPPI